MTIPQRFVQQCFARYVRCREPALFLLVGAGMARALAAQHSARQRKDANLFLDWIGRIDSGLGTTKAAIIIEPDALPADCYSPERANLLREAVHRLASAGHFTYLDAGHPRWRSTAKPRRV